MSGVPSVADVMRAKDNLDAFDAIINGDEDDVVTTPGGQDVKSVAHAIHDLVEEFGTVQILTGVTGSIALDASLGNTFILNLTGNTTITSIDNLPAFTRSDNLLVIKQPASGDKTITFPTAWEAFGKGVKPPAALGANAKTHICVTNIPGDATTVYPAGFNAVAGL